MLDGMEPDAATSWASAGPQVCRIVGITYRQLDYWARTDLVRPSLADARGSGTQRTLLVPATSCALKVVKSLLDAGVKLQTARKAIDYLREDLGDDWATASLVLDGTNSVLARTDDALVDLVRHGQGVLNIVPLGHVVDELDASIVELRARRRRRCAAAERAADIRRGRGRTLAGAAAARAGALRAQLRAAVREAARLLRIAWEYEPRTFALERDRDGNPAQAFTPDFYLPAYDLYIEITTLNQKLVTKKNRKARRLRELYPDVQIKVLYQRDYLHLLGEVRARAAVAARRRLRRRASRRRSTSFPRHRRRRSRPGAGRRVRVTDDPRAATTSPLDAEHRALGARMVPFGGWEMPIQYTRRARGAPRVPRARGRVRRVAPRLGARPRRRRVRHAAVGAHQRPRPHRARAGAVHPPARPRRRARRRRHHRVVGRAGRLPRDAERVEHRAARRRARRGGGVPRRRGVRRSTTSPPTARCSRCRDPRRASGWPTVVPERAGGRRASRSQPLDVRRRPRAGSPAPATPARTASSCTCPRRGGAECWRRAARRRHRARRARRARHAAARGRAAAARPRARPGHHAAAGRARLGRALRQGRLPRPRRRSRPSRTAGVARRLRGLVRRRPPDPARGSPGARAAATLVGEVTSGNFSPMLERGIALAFVPPDVVDGRRGHRRRPRPRRAPPSSRSCRSSAGSLGARDGQRRDVPEASQPATSAPTPTEIATMLDALGFASLDELIDRAVPEAIRDRDAARPARRR